MFFHGFDPNDPEEDQSLKGCLLRCSILLAIPSSIIFIIGSLNYSGFCWSKMRYLSDEEKFRSLFEVVNDLNTARIETKNKGTRYYERVKYKNFENFIEINPDCCAINPEISYEIPRKKFIDRITGFNNGDVIEMNYIVRYLNEDGQIKLQKTKTIGILQNCGEIKW